MPGWLVTTHTPAHTRCRSLSLSLSPPHPPFHQGRRGVELSRNVHPVLLRKAKGKFGLGQPLAGEIALAQMVDIPPITTPVEEDQRVPQPAGLNFSLTPFGAGCTRARAEGRRRSGASVAVALPFPQAAHPLPPSPFPLAPFPAAVAAATAAPSKEKAKKSDKGKKDKHKDKHKAEKKGKKDKRKKQSPQNDGPSAKRAK